MVVEVIEFEGLLDCCYYLVSVLVCYVDLCERWVGRVEGVTYIFDELAWSKLAFVLVDVKADGGKVIDDVLSDAL
jgi:hypothetical protein